ncbi:MAG: aryl-sulfate sulfotransferase, partial [Anaerolineae bacterium]|nr:aryl-sulfate sulfotransferase [Anaerolineae bacterium]
KFTPEEAVAAGRNPELISAENQLWGEAILEVDPATNEIVWEWHVWDHLVQDFDPAVANYGVVADHPELININYMDPEEQPNADWLHVNAIQYNAALDQIVLSTRTYSEIWVIDHSIPTEEARGEAGDLLFRWGNPATYSVGAPADRPLYFQHDPNWIPEGYPGAGNMLVFDNGSPLRPYSRVVEIALPTDESGAYIMNPGAATTPEIVWEYRTDPPEDFYSALISGAQRQPNGNTLITDGLHGRIFEVTPAGEIVWEYYMPPATWVFRSERYDLAGFDFDLSGDLGFAGGTIWSATCQDGTAQNLYEYLITQGPTMFEFMDQYGDNAQSQWAAEACTEHGGLG